jgi:coproporphyrinogen III oxidase-like Fe-S oxidoreductase
MLTNILRLLMARSVRPFIFRSNFKDILNIGVRDLGLYFHIPFCKKICSFCPYYKIKFDRVLLKEFYMALIKELYLVSETAVRKKEVTSIYFGGGSPALIVDYMSELMEIINDLFVVKGNIGIELHPREINERLLKRLKGFGFNMISVGVQSFQESCLNSLGREKINNEERLKKAGKAGFKVIDVDLIFSIPGQTKEDLIKDFKIAADSGATQISTYPFIEFSYTKAVKNPSSKRPGREMLQILSDIGRKMGYSRSSVWTFTRKNTPKYSSVTRDNYIGFGPSAASLLKNIFKVNTFSVKEYIKCLNGNSIPTALSLTFNERTRALYWLFWSSYNLDIKQNDFKRLFGRRLEDLFRFELYLGQKLKYLKKYKGGYRLTDKGAYIFHLVEQSYTHQYIDKTWRAAMGDPWPEKITLY